MEKITDGTGELTKADWIAFHERIFVVLDKKKTGTPSMRSNTSALPAAMSRHLQREATLAVCAAGNDG
jgi:hypothetical protein